MQAAHVHEGEVEPFDFEDVVSRETRMDILSSIPCYCDIQFSRKEFLTALTYPDHPFTKQIEALIREMTAKL
jgi:hypothetical protein